MTTGSVGHNQAGSPAFSKMCVTCVPNTCTNLDKKHAKSYNLIGSSSRNWILTWQAPNYLAMDWWSEELTFGTACKLRQPSMQMTRWWNSAEVLPLLCRRPDCLSQWCRLWTLGLRWGSTKQDWPESSEMDFLLVSCNINRNALIDWLIDWLIDYQFT